MKTRIFLAVLVAAATVSPATHAAVSADEPIQPIMPAVAKDPAKVELGKKLFFDPRLSKSGFISCNSCHNLSMGGSDNLQTSIGDHWQQGPINAPTVLNSSMSLAQFWDGRAKNLKEQAGGPIANPGEMAFAHSLAVGVLLSIPQYRMEFKQVYGSDDIDIDKLTDAIAAFEETLVTPDSRFDLWLKGDRRALSGQEEAGYHLFKSAGCVACHYGPAMGGSSFQKFGVHGTYQTKSKAEGRIAVTKQEEDRFKFKVPTLRNVELTYPYFHDGAAWTLEQAVETMGKLQLGRRFSKKEISDIVAFLKTLTGKQPDFKLPILPPSTNATPHPQPFP